MSMVISGDGTITGLAAGGLPDGSITQAEIATGVAGKGPAFSAYINSAQTLTANTYTKIVFNAEDFDTDSCFDSTTNYRFTPTVAGYYQVSCSIRFDATAFVLVSVYKNGSAYKNLPSNRGSNSSGRDGGSVLVYLNGSTDYVEIYCYPITTNTPLQTGTTWSYFQAAMVRAA